MVCRVWRLFLTGSGLDVFVGQSLVGLIGLLVLWQKWGEAVLLRFAETAATGEEPEEHAELIP